MDPRPAADIEEVARRVRALFRPSATDSLGRIGAEVELLTFDECRGRHGAVSLERLRPILAGAPEVSELAAVSFEPGGQLELSLPPHQSAAALVSSLREVVRRARARLERHGIGLASLPLDPWRSERDLGLQTPADRYLVMQRHFDSIGPSGQTMMRRTASLQVCIDSIPGREGRRQWLLANLLGPFLSAAFSHAALGRSSRTAVWLGVDDSRTGFDGRQVELDDPPRSYLGFALRAEVMPLPRADDPPSVELPFRTALGAWFRRGDARPDAEDIRHHLSTLFPPVRPRGYLEIRYVDAQPERWIAVPIVVLSALLGDREAIGLALEVTGGDRSQFRGRWERSARLGLSDPELRTVTGELFDIARTRATAPELRTQLGPGASDLIAAYAGRFLDTHAPGRIHSEPVGVSS